MHTKKWCRDHDVLPTQYITSAKNKVDIWDDNNPTVTIAVVFTTTKINMNSAQLLRLKNWVPKILKFST